MNDPYSESNDNSTDDLNVRSNVRLNSSTPRWVKVFGTILVLAILVFVIMLFTRGRHGPVRHTPSGGLDRLDVEAISQAAGTKATATEDGVVRIGWARDDVKVTVDKMPLKPFAGLTSAAAFHTGPHGAMVMGDMVVFQDEVTAAMDAAFKHGLEVTALHHHFFFDEPKVCFMHIGGSGDVEKLAAGVKAVWARGVLRGPPNEALWNRRHDYYSMLRVCRL